MVDIAIMLLIFSFLVDLYGAGLFAWWWAKNKGASFIFMCVTFMFIGDGYEKIIQIVGRYIRDNYTYSERFAFGASPWWTYKDIISTCSSLFIVCYLTARVIGWISYPPKK